MQVKIKEQDERAAKQLIDQQVEKFLSGTANDRHQVVLVVAMLMAENGARRKKAWAAVGMVIASIFFFAAIPFMTWISGPGFVISSMLGGYMIGWMYDLYRLHTPSVYGLLSNYQRRHPGSTALQEFLAQNRVTDKQGNISRHRLDRFVRRHVPHVSLREAEALIVASKR